MTAELRHYVDPHTGDEFIIIVTPAGQADAEDLAHGYVLQDKVIIEHDFTAWPTDRAMVQE